VLKVFVSTSTQELAPCLIILSYTYYKTSHSLGRLHRCLSFRTRPQFRLKLYFTGSNWLSKQGTMRHSR